MIDTEVFNSRKNTCSKCLSWKGVCLKGHALSSPVGCPEKKFPPVEGASYMVDSALKVPEPAKPGKCCGGTVGPALRELTYLEAIGGLADALLEWKKAGYPLTNDVEYGARVDICKSSICGYYRWYQCRACKCLIVIKAHLKSMDCPGHHWPKL